ncbi:terminase large subunit domain-containing protein [Hyalangium sp.]|uniref:terminase large subunit domain-containing protein n=1 Tax=Hyalangium sp. TaxID=2028555 RepID=UPI002D3A2439|nr:terminase family protein [Hyalangium sp.]HYH96019.1 terminase family protein [Hyalangium sp.]
MVINDALATLPLRTPETVGRYSLLEQVGLKARKKLRLVKAEVHEEVDQLTSTLDALLKLEYDEERLALAYEFKFSLRPVQCMPEGYWRTWFYCGGRGAGKTHAGSCAVITEAMADPEGKILIVGPTYQEIRKHQLEGPAGILTLCPPWFRPKYKKADHSLLFPNGAVAHWLPAQEADKFRGGRYSFLWLDEVVAWDKDPVEVLKQCFVLRAYNTTRMKREGIPSRAVITTTPRPTPVFRELLKPENRDGLVVSRSSTFDNAANLDPASVRQWRAVADTTEGMREFMGALFFDLDAGLYRKVNWEASRVKSIEHLPQRPEAYGEWAPAKLRRVHGDKITKPFDFLVVSVDPATGEKKSSDLHGVVVEGFRWEPDGLLHTYVLADLSLQAPESSAWATAAVKAYHAWKDWAPPKKTWIFAETNTGGTSLVKGAVHAVDKAVRFKGQRAGNGTGGKAERATPASMLAEKNLVHMVGRHHKLEKQLSEFTGAEGGHGRDDRADAFAWPIFLYVMPRRQMRGSVGEAAGKASEEGAEDEDDE